MCLFEVVYSFIPTKFLFNGSCLDFVLNVLYILFQLPSKLEEDAASCISRSILFGQCLYGHHSFRYANTSRLLWEE